MEVGIKEKNKTINSKSIVIDVNDSYIETDDVNFLYLLKNYYSSGKSVDEILNSPDKKNILYVSALYVDLRERGLTDSEIIDYLDRLVVCEMYTDETKEYPLLYGKANDLTNGDVYKYYELAKYMHVIKCSDKHEVVDGEYIMCDDISHKLNEFNNNELLFDNVINEIRDSEDKELNSSLNKILSNASVDKVECFRELDNLYSLGMIPGCVPEDVWNSSFHELLKTLGERDSLYENYYLLSVYTHEFMCDDDHYNNEYGSVECKTYKLK